MGSFSTIVFAFGALMAARAPAPQGDADSLVAKGVELRRKSEDSEALELFRRAHALAPSGRTLAQMGFAEVSLKRWLDAEQHLSDAIRAGDSYASKNRKLIDQQLADARIHIGTLQVVGPAGAAVLLDGRAGGTLPLAAPIRLAEGPVTISATAPGFTADDRKVLIEGGKEQTVLLAMKPVPAAPPVAALASAPEERAASASSGRPRWLIGGLAAASLVGLGTGATLMYLDGRTSCSSAKGPACPRVYTTQTGGIAALAAGAAAGVAAGVIYWRTGSTEIHVAAGIREVAILATF